MMISLPMHICVTQPQLINPWFCCSWDYHFINQDYLWILNIIRPMFFDKHMISPSASAVPLMDMDKFIKYKTK